MRGCRGVGDTGIADVHDGVDIFRDVLVVIGDRQMPWLNTTAMRATLAQSGLQDFAVQRTRLVREKRCRRRHRSGGMLALISSIVSFDIDITSATLSECDADSRVKARGAIALTRMPWGKPSVARFRVRPNTAAFGGAVAAELWKTSPAWRLKPC
jgi:hypothetical protein